MGELIDNLSAYLTVWFVCVFANTDTILSVGGLILLVIRLIADTPRAYKVVKGWFNVR